MKAAPGTIGPGRTDRPPIDGSEFLAWARDLHGGGRGVSAEHPRWCIVRRGIDHPGGAPYWQWSVPGYQTEVEILAWWTLPYSSRAALARTTAERPWGISAPGASPG